MYAYKLHGDVAWSDDYGNSWSDRASLNVAVNATASSASTGRLAMAANGSPLLLSTDGWQTQTQREIPRNWTAIASSADGSRLVAAAEGSGLFTSSDFGETWKEWERAHGFGWSVASSADGRKLVAAAFEGQIYTAEGLVAFGLPGSEGTLQYTGGGQWRAVGVPQGTITGGQLENRAVSRDHLASDIGVWRGSGTAVYRNEFENVGIGTAAPRFPLSFGNTAFGSVRVALYDSGFTAPIGIGATSDTFRLQLNDFTSRFAFGIGNSGFDIVTIKGTGQVGIGTTAPNYPLSLGSGVLNTKLALYDSGGSIYGLGIGSAQFRLHVDQPSARFSFLDSPSGNEVLTVKGTGQLGLGTANPLARMHIYSTDNPAVLRLQSTGTPGFGRLEFLSNPQGDPGEWRPGYIQSTDAGGFTGGLSFVVNGTGFANRFAEVEAMRLQNGRTGIGRAPAANRLEVEGDASKTTAGSWLANSDRRIKTDIQPVTGALETLEKIKLVTFRYTKEYRRAHPDIKDIAYHNVIAQEFRDVFPNAVQPSGEKLPDGSGILQVDTYPAMITAIAGIKELRAENRQLREENEVIRRRLNAVEELLRSAAPPQLSGNTPSNPPKKL
jgi:hypothetical protein